MGGTLGYAGSWMVAVPAGTSATDLQQARQQETSARASYAAAQATASADEQTLAAANQAIAGAHNASLTAEALTAGGLKINVRFPAVPSGGRSAAAGDLNKPSALDGRV